MNEKTLQTLHAIKTTYDSVMAVMEHDAKKSLERDERVYGGFVRAAKGKMQEYLTEELVKAAWGELKQPSDRLKINSQKIKIPILKKPYVERISDERVRDYILSNLQRYTYGLSVDKHVFIDGMMVMGIECKAYTENAMLKRILVDFFLLKTKLPNLSCLLFQLESQLGGDYNEAKANPLGSAPTHTIMSYFSGIDLKIVTLLKGERKVDRPINKPGHFKPLSISELQSAVEILTDEFRKLGFT